MSHGSQPGREPEHRGRWLATLLVIGVFCVSFGIVFWIALVHTIHEGTQTVPSLRGRTLEEAQRLLHDRSLGIRLAQPGAFDATIPAGAIARQEPRAGFHVKSGAIVTVRLSLGGERIIIPDVQGESLQGAAGVLEQVGLRPGRRVKIDGGAEGNSVLATDPPAGSAVTPSTAIDILFNQAPHHRLWVMPNLLAVPLERVQAFFRRNRFRLGQVHRVPYAGVPAGEVVRQYPPAGSPLSTSDIITVWIVQ
ncbi:MAG: PASTA domain-containing protein [Acidobacteria bacterium]|nr:PASTA domain-containing protein [Acidobacteriota bacterium]